MFRILVLVILISVSGGSSMAEPPRARESPSDNRRVAQLLSELTLDEKMHLIHDAPEDPGEYQGQAGYIGGVPRLGIPGLRLADGPPGVLTRHPSQAEVATMGVAAT